MAQIKNDRDIALQAAPYRSKQAAVTITGTAGAFLVSKNTTTILPARITLTATPGGSVYTSSAVYTWSYCVNNAAGTYTQISSGTNQKTLVLNNTDSWVKNPYVYYKCVVTEALLDTSVAYYTVTYTAEASDPVTVNLSRTNVLVTCDSNGNAINYNNTDQTITVNRGTTALAYSSNSTTPNSFSVSYSASNLTASAGTGSGTSWTQPAITAIQQDGATLSYSITVYDSAAVPAATVYGKTVVYNKVSNGTIGANGSDGANLYPVANYDFAGTALPSGVTYPGTVTPTDNGTTLTIQNTVADQNLRLTNLNLVPATSHIISMRIKWVSGTWDGLLFYINTVHGEDGAYYKAIPQPALGVWTTINVDMRTLNAGDTDYMTGGNIRQLRFDFVNDTASQVAIDYISVGKFGIAEATKSTTVSMYVWAPSGQQLAYSGAFTYTWSTNTISAFPAAYTNSSNVVVNWTSTAQTAPDTGYTLYQRTLVLLDVATATTTTSNWSNSLINSIGYRTDGSIGRQGDSYRIAYTVTTSATAPSTPAVSTAALAPSGWSYTATATLNAGEYMYQSDGVLNYSTGNITWGIPYLSNLKVGSLSALTANLGTVSIASGGALYSGKTSASDTSNAGFFLGNDSGTPKFKIGNASNTSYLSWDGNTLTANALSLRDSSGTEYLSTGTKASDILNSNITISSTGALIGAGGGQTTITGLGYTGALNANNTYVDAAGAIQGVSLNAGTAVKNTNITISSTGALIGAGGGQTTITGLGYTGALNATYGADFLTNVTNRPTSTNLLKLGTFTSASTGWTDAPAVTKSSVTFSGTALDGVDWIMKQTTRDNYESNSIIPVQTGDTIWFSGYVNNQYGSFSANMGYRTVIAGVTQNNWITTTAQTASTAGWKYFKSSLTIGTGITGIIPFTQLNGFASFGTTYWANLCISREEPYANATYVDNSGAIQGVSQNSGTIVQNTKITITEAGAISGIGTGDTTKVANSNITISNNGTLVGGATNGGQVTLSGMGQQVYRAVSRGLSNITTTATSGIYLNGNLSYTTVRSYSLTKISRSTGAILSHQTYDVYGAGETTGGRNAATLTTDLNACDSTVIVIVNTYDEPYTNRLTSGLPAAMYRCGASRTVFGSDNFKVHGSYILVGIPGCGEGNGAEAYQGSVNDDVNAFCDMSFTVLNGSITGVSGTYTPLTLRDYNYTGDSNATVGAPAGTYVAGVLAETVLDNITTAQTTADGKLSKSGTDIINSQLYMNTTRAMWYGAIDANGNLAGDGLWMGKDGLVGQKSGITTFAIRNDGSAIFGGELTSNSSGTFGGSLRADVLSNVALSGIVASYTYAQTITITMPAGKNALRITLLGGGGGGGGGASRQTYGVKGGGGGGAGALVTGSYTGLSPGMQWSLVIGSGGTGGTPVDPGTGAQTIAGSSGGDSKLIYLGTIFGITNPTIITAAGGTGGAGAGSGNGGSIGGGSGGGQTTSSTDRLGNTTYYITSYGGIGGSTAYGTGGAGATFNTSIYTNVTTAGQNGAGNGSGGGGGAALNNFNGPGYNSGNGAPGYALVEFYDANGVVLQSAYNVLLTALQRQGIAIT